MNMMITASKDTCQHKERTSKANKWLNSKVKSALKLMRNNHSRCKVAPTCHRVVVTDPCMKELLVVET